VTIGARYYHLLLCASLNSKVLEEVEGEAVLKIHTFGKHAV